MEQQVKVPTPSRWIRRGIGILGGLLFLAILLTTVYILVCQSRGKPASFFGNYLMEVETGSMAPSIAAGDFILVQKTDTSTLSVGDIICFYSEEEEIAGLPNTHRIIDILPDGSFVTKGDANSVKDSMAVQPDHVIGKYAHKLRFFRWLKSFTSMRKLLLLGMILVFAGTAVYEIRTIAKLQLDAKAEDKEAQLRVAIEEEKAKLYAADQSNKKDGEDSDS